VGTNPQYGADINYWRRVGPDSVHPDSQAIQIVDAAGRVVRTLKHVPKAGLNRVWWDLSFDPTPEARIRTSPQLAAWREVRPEGMPAPGVGRFAMLAPPGRYTVRLTIGGQTVEQPLDVLKDPNSGASEDDLRAQSAFVSDAVADIDSTVAMINRIEVLRGQLASVRATLSGDSSVADVRAQADSLDRKLVAVEEPLFQMRVTGRGQDILRWPMRLAEQQMYLVNSVTSSDYAPTAPQREVQHLLSIQVKDARARLDRAMAGDVAAFRQFVRSKNLPNVVF
jgi:hypothetical protein